MHILKILGLVGPKGMALLMLLDEAQRQGQAVAQVLPTESLPPEEEAYLHKGVEDFSLTFPSDDMRDIFVPNPFRHVGAHITGYQGGKKGGGGKHQASKKQPKRR